MQGHSRAQLALDVFIAAIRQYVGGYLALLGGADAIVFSGGIGENSKVVRAGVLRDMEWCGLKFDATRNEAAKGEALVSADGSSVQAWVIPTNEELVVARQTAEALGEGK